MATMNSAPPRVSFADVERWPEDGRRYELYGGEVYVVPFPLPLHQIALMRLYDAFRDHTRTHGGIVLVAPLDIVLTEFDVVQPDLLYFTPERRHLVQPRRVTRDAPDLVVEILSPGTARHDRGRKMALLGRFAVREVWLVDPDAVTIEIFHLQNDRYALASRTTGDEPVRSPLVPAIQVTPNDVARIS